MTTLALVAGLFASPAIHAQEADMDGDDRKTPEDRAKHRTEMMTKELGLSPEQIARVNTININFARALSDVKKMEDGDVKKNRATALKEKRDNDLKPVLTAEQFTRMNELRDKKKDQHKDKKVVKEKAEPRN